MPLYPPPQPVQHPADLVIDVFGTFLGRKSERMIVRWREAAGGASVEEMTRAIIASTAGAGPDSPSPVEVPAQHDASADSPSELDLAHADASPAASHSATAPSETARSSASHSATSRSEAAHAATGQSATDDGEANGPPHPADQAASELIQFWAQQPRSQENLPPSPPMRLKAQLDGLADGSPGRRPCNGWRERGVPLSRLRSVTISGRGVTVSSDLVAALVERGISLSFLSGRGQPVAQVSAPGLGGTVQTRRSQLAAYDSSLGVDLAVEFIRGKLRNQKHQLQYSGKYLKSADPARFERLARKIKALGALRKQLAAFGGDRLDVVRDKLMGYEGTGARVYWEGVAILLQGRVDFPGRSTRGALDPVNSALNYGYGILYGQVSGAVVNAGLEMYAGFLHVDRPGKPALVLDLVEEFRAPIVDRAVLAIVNQGIALETDAHGLTAPTRRLVANRILERLSARVPYEGGRWALGTIIQNQARHLAVAVRGERVYRAFASRW